MSYVSRRLAPGETIQYEGKFHWIQKAWPWVALLALGVLVVGIVIWIIELVRMATTQMVVTNRRVLLRKGFFSIKLDELTLGSIEGSHVDQSIFGRIFGYGRLTLRGRGETEILFPTMDRPGAFRAAIEDARMQGEVQPVGVAHEPEPAADETRRERKLRLRLEAERERRAHHHH